MKLTERARRGRSAFKRFLYSQLYMRDSFLIMFGKSKPLVQFKVEDSPPSVYFNFEISPDKVEEFSREIDLPMPMCKIRCLEDEEPFYALTLNIYRVSGLANGIRAEWSVYVSDTEGVPRYLVVEARADSGSVDSVEMITTGSDVTYAQEGDVLSSRVSAGKGGYFESKCRGEASGGVVRADPQWIQANDYIYWLNGVCDRTFYDSGLANARIRLYEPAQVDIKDDTAWSQWVDPVPRHSVIFEDAIEFAMSPWWNIRDL